MRISFGSGYHLLSLRPPDQNSGSSNWTSHLCRPALHRWQGIKGYLDEQFLQLEELQDDLSPNFVEEVVTLFFRDSARLVTNIEQALEQNPHDFLRLDGFVHQLKGSSSSIGAVRVKNECSVFREYCNQGNMEGCLKSFQKVKREHAVLRQKLEKYFQVLNSSTGPFLHNQIHHYAFSIHFSSALHGRKYRWITHFMLSVNCLLLQMLRQATPVETAVRPN